MLSIASTSRMRGTLRTITSSSVRRDDARIGSAPFLLPAGTIVPESGTPPSMTNFSISCGARRRRPHGGAFASRLASVTAICTVKFAPRAHYPARCAARARGRLPGRASIARRVPLRAPVLQFRLQPDPRTFGSSMRVCEVMRDTYVRSYRLRPSALLPSTNRCSQAPNLQARAALARRPASHPLIPHARGRLRRRLGGRRG